MCEGDAKQRDASVTSSIDPPKENNWLFNKKNYERAPGSTHRGRIRKLHDAFMRHGFFNMHLPKSCIHKLFHTLQVPPTFVKKSGARAGKTPKVPQVNVILDLKIQVSTDRRSPATPGCSCSPG